jgi:hypothetical protein
MTTVSNNPSGQYSYGTDNTSGTEGKKTETKPDQNTGDQAGNTDTANNPYQKPDSNDVNADNTKNSDHPVTVFEFDKSSDSADTTSETGDSSAANQLYNKSEYTPQEALIADYIAKIHDDTWKTIIESFDRMLEHARKMMEEHQRMLREKVIPREEAMKKEVIKDEMQKKVEEEHQLGLT